MFTAQYRRKQHNKYYTVKRTCPCWGDWYRQRVWKWKLKEISARSPQNNCNFNFLVSKRFPVQVSSELYCALNDFKNRLHTKKTCRFEGIYYEADYLTIPFTFLFLQECQHCNRIKRKKLLRTEDKCNCISVLWTSEW